MVNPSSTNERRSLLAGITVAALMIAQQVGAKATRDAFFLSEHGAEHLPHVMVASAVLSLLTAFGMARALLKVGPSRAVVWAFALSGLSFVGEWFGAAAYPALVSVLLYLHLGAFGPIVISGFWSVVNERFDPHTAKAYVTRMGASAAAGGALGGLLAERVTASLSLLAMLPVLALVNWVCAIVLPALARGAAPAPVSSAPREPLRVSGYLKTVAAIVALTSMAGGLLDFAVKAEAASVMTRREDLAAFFAYLHAVLGVVGFLVQSLLSGRLLKTVGLGATLALLPGVIALGGALGAAVTRLWSVILAKGLESSVRSSAFRSSYELLYIPVERRQKRAAKTLIDVGADRAGDILAAGVAMLALAVLPAISVSLALGAAAGVSLVCLGLSFAVHRGYVAELASSLRSGTLKVDEIGVQDATTARTLADTTMALNRDELLAEIEALRRQKVGSEGAATELGGPEPSSERSSPAASEPRPRVLQRAQTLLQNDASRVNALLAEPDLEKELLPLILPLLAQETNVKHALAALRRLSPNNEGQLADALLDTRQPLEVRAMLPRVLRHLPTERARDGLLWGLKSDAFVVRHQAARSLARLCSQHPELRPEEGVVFAAIAAEQGPNRSEAEMSRALSRFSDHPPSAFPAPRLDYALTLLSVLYEREPLALCRTAFARGDSMMRGTAVEYLENLLPNEVFRTLQPHFDVVPPSVEQRRARQRADIVAELANSATSLDIDLDAIRDA